ncbi:histone-lysine N-methyltransferase NSD3 isoform X4 [Dendropsophus ebraccatus]|uniref:histone-lysine N-methyltransferase NSD3 isoform X4 n=1 Tax=Dendropsophus ebraccatus TaxID=150705 RepID=UPI00383147D8
MDFSFSFMQGIMGNTIQQPPQLIDSANNRQDDANSSDQADEGGHTPYDSGLQTDFQYPTPTTEDLPPLTNGYQSSLGYDSQVKYAAFSQYPNGSANGYGTRSYSTLEYYHHLETAAMRPHEGVLKSSPPQPTSPPNLLQPPPSSTIITQKKTGSPEIKLRITKTIQNGREMFESSLCGDLLHEVQANEFRRKHERRKERKEKRKKSRHHHHHHHHHHHREELKADEPPPHDIQKLEPPEEEIAQHLPISPLPSEVRTGVWFHVGDLVWSKVGTYPWWPCMVSCDPQLHVHSKINTRGAREYHVQFFSNEPERAWVHEKRMREYRGQKQYEQLVAEDSAKVVNQSERLKMRKPRPQKERIQWDIGIAHAEKALRMTREERIEQYTFIYVDPETSPEPKKAAAAASNKRSRRSTSSSEAEPARPKEVSSPPSKHSAPVQSPPSKTDNKDSVPETRRQSQRKQVQEEEPTPPQPPPAKIPWKTAAARKSLPASVLLHKGTIDLQKCNMSPVVKIENVLALHNASPDGFEQFIYTTKGVGNKTEITVKAPEKTSVPSPNLKAEKMSAQHTPAPETSSGATGTSEKKHQRRSNRTRSESEKSLDSVPKKKVKKEQVDVTPLTAVQTGLQKD